MDKKNCPVLLNNDVFYLDSEVFSFDVPQRCSDSAFLYCLLRQNVQKVQRQRRKASKGDCCIKGDMREREGSAEGV